MSVRVYDTQTGAEYVFASVMAASRFTNIAPATIERCIKSGKGFYRWVFSESVVKS